MFPNHWHCFSPEKYQWMEAICRGKVVGGEAASASHCLPFFPATLFQNHVSITLEKQRPGAGNVILLCNVKLLLKSLPRCQGLFFFCCNKCTIIVGNPVILPASTLVAEMPHFLSSQITIFPHAAMGIL